MKYILEQLEKMKEKAKQIEARFAWIEESKSVTSVEDIMLASQAIQEVQTEANRLRNLLDQLIEHKLKSNA